jgi:hypothetical protein
MGKPFALSGKTETKLVKFVIEMQEKIISRDSELRQTHCMINSTVTAKNLFLIVSPFIS